jgi:hypothetical protein
MIPEPITVANKKETADRLGTYSPVDHAAPSIFPIAFNFI